MAWKGVRRGIGESAFSTARIGAGKDLCGSGSEERGSMGKRKDGMCM